MNLFWIFAAGAAFALSLYVLTVVILTPSQSSKHLYAITGSYLIATLTGMLFMSMVAVAFLL